MIRFVGIDRRGYIEFFDEEDYESLYVHKSDVRRKFPRRLRWEMLKAYFNDWSWFDNGY